MSLPDTINTGFMIDEPLLWKEDLEVEEIPISEIEYNLDIPYLEQEGTNDWNLSPRMLITNFEKELSHAKKIMEVDLTFPIYIYLYKKNG